MISTNDKWNSPTAYHFHNFFLSGEEIRFKYSTYRHALPRDLRNGGDLLLAEYNGKADRRFDSIQVQYSKTNLLLA